MSTLFRFGPFTIDLAERVVVRDGQPVALPPKVFDTLAVLVEQSGRVVSKDELMARVWPDTIVEESNLTQNIFTLRRALGEEGRSIETVPRRGYRLSAPVELVIESRQSVRIVTEEERDGPRSRTTLVLSIAIAVLSLVSIAQFVRRTPDRLETLEVRKLTTGGNVESAAISPDGRFIAWVANENDGISIRLRQIATTSEVRIVPPSSVRVDELTFSPDGEHVYYLSGPRGESSLFAVSTLGGNPRKVLDDVRSPVSFAPDGKRFAFIRWFPESGEQGLMIASLDGGAPRRLITRKRPRVMDYRGPSWSPDGERIALVINESFGGSAATLITAEVRDGTERVIARNLGAAAGKVAWLPDGSGIVVASEQLWLYSYPDGERKRITNDALSYSSITVSGDGKRVAAVQTTRPTDVWLMPDDKRILSGSGINNGVSWLGDGRLAYLATHDGNTDVWIARADGSDPRQLTLSEALDNHPSVCGERAIVFASARNGGSTIWRMDADGGNQRQISGEGTHYGLDCAPDGTWLAFHRDDRVHSWSVWRMPTNGGAAQRLTDRPATFPAVSPDGRRIACNYHGANGWTIAIMDADGTNLRVLDAPGVPTRRLRWSPDGAAIVFARERNRIDNLVRLPIDGGAEETITSWDSARILAFDYSPDGSKLAVVRTTPVSDVVMLSAFR